MNDFSIGNPNIKVNSNSFATGPEFMTNTTTIDPKAGVSPQYKNAAFEHLALLLPQLN